jgi:hypothetical protein
LNADRYLHTVPSQASFPSSSRDPNINHRILATGGLLDDYQAYLLGFSSSAPLLEAGMGLKN